MTTTWTSRPALDRKSWLLTNGEVVHEPALEESGSGIKVRIAGTKISAYAKDVDNLILQGVELIADRKGAEVWMPMEDANHGFRNRYLSRALDKGVPELHVLTTQDYRNQARTLAWWEFRHQALPVEATLVVEAAPNRYGSNRSSGARPQEIHVYLAMQPTTLHPYSIAPIYVKIEDAAWTNLVGHVSDYNGRLKVQEFLRDHKPADWTPGNLLGEFRYDGERPMVEALLLKVREADSLTRIQVPDLRDPTNPKWLDLELHETNMNNQFLSNLVDYLDGAPTIEHVAKLYREMQKTFRAIGVVLADKSENDFQAALQGNRDGVTVEVSSPAEVGHTVDREHKLYVDLFTGTFIVGCTKRDVDRNQVATKWDEALTLAQLTGREEEFLAYARQYADEAEEKRRKTIVHERKTGTTD